MYNFLRTPRLIEKWFWTWTAFAIYSSVKCFLMIPFDIVRVFASLLLGIKGYTSKYSSWSSIMVVITLLIFTS